MSGLFEAALHVQAMRLVCEASADREQNGIEVDWNVLRQMHDQMDAMLQELQHKHRYDSSEIVDLRKDRDHWREEWQGASAAGELMKAEIDSLRQQLRGAHAPAMAQQSEEIAYLRARLDEERSVIASLRQQLDESQARRVVVSNEAANDKLQKIAIHCELRAAQDEIASLRQQLDAANAAVTLQRAGIELQRRVVDKVRQMLFRPNRDIEYGDINGLRAALAELDAQPAPVAETEGGT